MPASGIQIAFLIFAVAFLAAPAQRIAMAAGWPEGYAFMLGRLLVLAPAVLIFASIPALRERCIAMLRTPIGEHRREVALVSAAHLMLACAAVGAVVLWQWSLGGEAALARRIGMQASPAREFEDASSADGILGVLVLGGFVAPIVEEIAFRGFLYQAWSARWGWVNSAIATSAAFAVYHANYFSSFAGSLVFIALLRRTGSLRAAIVAHMTFNVALWYPLLGQVAFRTRGRETGSLGDWGWHIACLAVGLIAVPAYLWMARDRAEP